tara:strand:- start:217 stop:2091 length:1875 start_codon:yes stop_codon:yes gene_type:complete
MPLTDAERQRIDVLLGTVQDQGLSDAEKQRIDSLLGPADQPAQEPKDDSFLGTLGRTISNVPGDIAPTVGEEFSAFGEVLSDPVAAAKGIYNVGSGVVDTVTGDDTPESRMAKDAYYQFTGEIKDFEKRPVRAAVNLAAIGSGLATGGAGLATRAPKAASILAKAGKALDYFDPVATTAKAATGAVKLPFKGAKKTVETVAGVTEDAAQQGSRGLLGQVFDSFLGFTTGTSNTALQKVREFAASDKADVMREFRRDSENGRLRVIDKYVDDYRKIKQAASEDYEVGKQALIDNKIWNSRIGQSDMDALAQLREAVNQPLSEFGAGVKLSADGTASVDFPYGEATIAKGSRGRIDKALSEIISPNLKALKNGIDVAYVDKLKKEISDEISSISALDGTSKQARKALVEVESNLRKVLNQASNDQYGKLMRPYREKMETLEAADDFFSIRPGDAVKVKGRDVKSGGYGRLAQALNDRSDTYAALQQFEDMAARSGGSGDLIASLTGTIFNPLFGSGLVVKSEIAQAGRAIVGFEALLGAIPALALFSPRAVGEITQRMVSRGVPLRQARARANALVSTFNRMNNKINKTLPGDMTFKDGLREGVTLGQLIERLNEDAELSKELEGK